MQTTDLGQALELAFQHHSSGKWRQAETLNSQIYNLRAAAINAFAADQWNRKNPDPFCKRPLYFIRVYNALD